MSNLEQKRRELERERDGEPVTRLCPVHGEHATLICVHCYSIQQERVERESAPLRYANTASSLRRRVLADMAEMNGHARS